MTAALAVLVTGANTGIGRRVTQRLIDRGHYVYAGARSDADLDALGRIKNVRPLRLDVTDPRHIEAAVEVVTQAGLGLYGLVNNAGVATAGTVIGGSDSEFDLVMAVNAYGPYRITKAFAPLIVAARGRIITMGSVAGISGAGGFSAYCMSKHAVEAFTDSLAQEMEPLRVHVSIIEPSRFHTGHAQKAIERMGSDPGLPDLSQYDEPDVVVDAVELALFEPNPKRRYLVVSSADTARAMIKAQIARLVQLNARHAYTYDREALIGLLDEALAAPASPNAVR